MDRLIHQNGVRAKNRVKVNYAGDLGVSITCPERGRWKRWQAQSASRNVGQCAHGLPRGPVGLVCVHRVFHIFVVFSLRVCV